MTKPKTPRRALALLSALYFVQGLPFGLQTTALPVLLRERGASLIEIGFLSALALPWMFKIFWAPLVDARSSPRWGRRRSWILPTQLLLAVACGSGALFADPAENVRGLLIAIFLANLAAATMDVAVDGLAVDVLSEQELGYGNIAQVVGYKIGMVVGGGISLIVAASVPWSTILMGMAALVLAVFLITLTWRENGTALSPESNPSLRVVVGTLSRALAGREGRLVLLVVATYKIGESMSDAMLRPFLVDTGWTAATIGAWLGTWGLAFSLAGSFAGGLLAARTGSARALFQTAIVRVVPLVALWWASLRADPGEDVLVLIVCLESFAGGAITTALFAWMMGRVRREIGAAHFTAFATVEVWGKLPASWAAGVLGEWAGYGAVFALGAGLSAAYVALLAWAQLQERIRE